MNTWAMRALLAAFFVIVASLAFVVSRKRQAASDGVKIMTLGDSITYGEKSSDGGGYRSFLWERCLNAGYRVHFVGSQSRGPASIETATEGHSGWRIDQISSRVIKWLNAYHPHIILLHIGTNDIVQDYRVSAAPERLSTLIDKITSAAPNALLIVAQVTPLGNTSWNQRVRAYNAAIPEIVQSKVVQGNYVHYADMYKTVRVSDLADGIHPNDIGYSLMADVWYEALVPLFPKPSLERCPLLKYRPE